MAFFKPGKEYGLILRGKKAEQTRAKPLSGSNMKKTSIFGADSSDSDNDKEGESESDWMAKSMKVKANNSGLKKQAKIQMSKALEEDPTVFQYDEVYDDMEKKKEVEKESKKDIDRKPKYVHNLLKAADERQKEFERRVERQVQKEREAEGDMYADKESFVTSAYRKKMEEIAKQEEEEARKAQIEAALDVRKQNNMDGFYRHLYRQTMGEEKEQVEARKKEEETEEEKAARIKEEIKKIKIEEENPKKEVVANTTIKKIEKKKMFRKKETTVTSSDSDSETDSSGDENEKEGDPGKEIALTAEEKFDQRKKELQEQREKREKRKRKIEQDASSSESEDDTQIKKTKDDDGTEFATNKEPEVEEVKPEPKPKVDIWAKRTVGEVFESAVQKYWERRAAREAGR